MDYNSAAAWLQTPQISDLQTVSVHDERSATGSNGWKETAASVQGGGLSDFLGELSGEHEHFWTGAGHSDASQASGSRLEQPPTNAHAHPASAPAPHTPTPPLSQSSNPYSIGIPAILLSTSTSYYPQWANPQLPVVSSYSSLDGANSAASQSQQQGQGQNQSQGPSQSQGSSPMVIDPALTTMNGSSSSPPPHQYPQVSYLSQQGQSRMQYPYPQSAHQSMLSINPSYMHSGPSQYQQQGQQQQQHSLHLLRQSHSPPQQQQQGTLSPFALHSPGQYYGGIPPSTFYGQSSQPVASSSIASPSVSQATSQSTATPPPAASSSKPSAEQRRTSLLVGVRPLIQPDSFTGGGAVSQLVKILDDHGIAEVDAQIRLDILTKIRDNAGNHYFRAWVDNSIAMEIVREWLKLAFIGRGDQQMVETIMPLLHIIDRLPLTLEKLKQSKLGKLIMKLMKEPPTPAIKDMAANLERKWRKMLSEQEVPDRAESENAEDTKGKKRRADSVSSKSAPPVKKAAVPATGSSTPKAVPVKKESKPVVKDAKSDSSFFSKPKPTKKELPSFKKIPSGAAASSSTAPAKKEPDPNVAQPSSVDAFQEVLKSLQTPGSSSSATPPTAPGPSAGPSTGPASGPSGGPTLGKRKKSVTWAPDGKLEQIKLIERAVYDDDGAPGSLSSHNIRDLDRDEGAALHNHLAFEEQMEWTEPQPLEFPPELEVPPRGGESQERVAQEEREQTALVASYASPAQIPDSPAEPPTQIPEEQVDEGVRLMLTGPEVDAIFWSDGAPALVDTIRPSTSVAELVGQLAAAPSHDIIMGDASHPPAVPPLANFNPEQLQQLMQQAQALSQGGLFGGLGAPPHPPAAPHGGDQGWGNQYTEFDRGYHEPNGVGRGADPGRRWGEDGWGPGERGGPRGRGRGGPMRGRGRGDGNRNAKRKPCSFFQAGRRALQCRYGDQCDFSHEPLNYN
ncbi:hypothetical protein BV20DRAFT_1026689 [Pilatotrama ljubarskyi]|nr:hypothetical protein BV20DRAFT_1026689 [Pilatotrama ljubarskyi]